MRMLPPIVFAAILFGPTLADAGCLARRDADDLERSLRRSAACRHDLLKGRVTSCEAEPAPACAGTLVGDALALAYGAERSAGGAVDDRALADQLRCQKKIGERRRELRRDEAARSRQRGKDDADAREREARDKLDRLPRHCERDGRPGRRAAWCCPPSAPQCAAAVGAPGATRRRRRSRDCLATLLGVWVDRARSRPAAAAPEHPLHPDRRPALGHDRRARTRSAAHDVMPRTRAELGGARRRVHARRS